MNLERRIERLEKTNPTAAAAIDFEALSLDELRAIAPDDSDPVPGVPHRTWGGLTDGELKAIAGGADPARILTNTDATQ